jgi:NitT/TauT family transport system substrate-binding protein
MEPAGASARGGRSHRWLPLVLGLGVLAAWQGLVDGLRVPPYLLPSPATVAVKVWADREVLGAALGTTLAEALAGYALGNAAGFALAVLFFYRPRWERLALGPIVASNSVPVVAFAPVVIIWFGLGMTAKVVLVAFVTGFLTLQAALQGLRQVDPQAESLLRAFGARESRIFWTLRLPAALPHLFTALRVGSVRSVIVAIVAEMLGSYRGLGWVIFETTSSMDYLRLWAAVLTASAAGVVFFVVVSAIERRALWWHVSVSGGRRRARRRSGGLIMPNAVSRWFVCLGLAAVAAGATAAPVAAQDRVSLRLKWLHQAQFAGYYVAQDKGFYRDEKLEVTINPGGPNIVAENLVASGAEDFAQGGGMESLLTGRDKGLPLVAVGVVFQKAPTVFVAKKESGVTRLEDFVGKKVSTWYTGPQFILRAMLRSQGVDPGRITEVPQPVTMAPFLRNEVAVAAANTYNELQTLYAEGLRDLVIFDPAEFGIVIPRDTIVTSERMVREKPDVVQRFLRASLRGWKYAIENQAEAVDIVMKQNPNLKKDHQTVMMREVARLVVWGPGKDRGIGYIDRRAAEFTQKFLLENQQLTKPVALDQAYTMRFWENVPATDKQVK